MDSRNEVIQLPVVTGDSNNARTLIPCGVKVTYRRRAGKRKARYDSFVITVDTLKQIVMNCFKTSIPEPLVREIYFEANVRLDKSQLKEYARSFGNAIAVRLGYLSQNYEDREHSFLLELLYHHQATDVIESVPMKRLVTDSERLAVITRAQLFHAQVRLCNSKPSLLLGDRDNS
jgi:hypothetical protein